MSSSEPTNSEPSSSNKRRTLRPDQMSGDICEFLAAVDLYKRETMRKFLELDEILDIFVGLGYASRDGQDRSVESFSAALEDYKAGKKCLFPNLSEMFEVLSSLGYDRTEE